MRIDNFKPPDPITAAPAHVVGPPGAPGHGLVYKPNDRIRPQRLSTVSTPLQARQFVQQYKVYHTTSGFETRNLQEQQFYFLSCLEGNLRERIESQLTPHTDILDNDPHAITCISILREEFDLLYPILQNRLIFQKATQELEENFADFVTRVKKLARQADIENLTPDQTILLRILEGTTNELIRQEILKMDKPQLEDSITVGRRLAETSQSIQMMTSRAEAAGTNPSSSKFFYGNNKPPGKSGTGQKDGNRPPRNNTCYRCGASQDHRKGCWAKDKICHKCGLTGHIQIACRRKTNPQAQAASAKPPQIQDQEPTTDGGVIIGDETDRLSGTD